MITVEEALARCLALATRLGSETVPLREANGRVMASVATARLTQPPFAASAMDGYALRATDLGWREFFPDPRLQALIGEALENNRDLRVAALNIDATRAKLQVARADELPTVNAGINGSRGPNTAGAVVSSYTAGLSVTAYELDFFGRVRALSQAAQSQLLATEEARKTVQISLIASVANTYLTLLADDELLRITQIGRAHV